jgi:hypothetical protein
MLYKNSLVMYVSPYYVQKCLLFGKVDGQRCYSLLPAISFCQINYKSSRVYCQIYY